MKVGSIVRIKVKKPSLGYQLPENIPGHVPGFGTLGACGEVSRFERQDIIVKVKGWPELRFAQNELEEIT